MSGAIASAAAVLNSIASNGAAAGGSVTFGSTGAMSGTSSPSFSGDLGRGGWYRPNLAGIGASFFLKLTKTSGPANFSGFTAVTAIGAGAIITAIGGVGAAIGTWQIYADAGGTKLLGAGTITVDNSI